MLFDYKYLNIYWRFFTNFSPGSIRKETNVTHRHTQTDIRGREGGVLQNRNLHNRFLFKTGQNSIIILIFFLSSLETKYEPEMIAIRKYT